jgi:pimeloyl-ACP methyl ester carboxylesterase
MNDALVLAHGAFHGPWCWHPTSLWLERHDVRCVAVDLNRGGLEPDRAALQGVVDELVDEGCRVHAIGHSLGCASVAALDPSTLATATFLAGPVAGPGMPSPGDCIFPNFLEKLLPQQDGRSFMSRENCWQAFYHRCEPSPAEWALDRLRPTFVYGAEATATPLWEAIPVTYIECLDDRAVRPDFQNLASKVCTHSATLDSDHSPMLGQPEALGEVILETLTRGC